MIHDRKLTNVTAGMGSFMKQMLTAKIKYMGIGDGHDL